MMPRFPAHLLLAFFAALIPLSAQTTEILFDDEALTEEVGALRSLATRRPLDEDAIRRIGLGLQALFERDTAGTRLLPVPERPELALSPRTMALRLALSLPPVARRALVERDEASARIRRAAGDRDEGLARRFPLSSTGRAARWRLALRRLEAGDANQALRHLHELDLVAAGLGDEDAAPDARRPARDALRLLALEALGDRAWIERLLADPEALAGSARIAGASRALRDFAASLLAEDRSEETPAPEFADRPAWISSWPRDDDLPGAPCPRIGHDRVIAHDAVRARALSRETGEVLWERVWGDEDGFPAPTGDFGTEAFAGAVVGDSYVFATRAEDLDEGHSALVAIGIEDGTTRWVRFRTVGISEGPSLVWDPRPLALGDTVIATAVDREAIPSTVIAAINVRTGGLRWSRKIRSGLPFDWKDPEDGCPLRPRRVGASTALIGGGLVVADHRGQILVIDPDRGSPRLRWTYERRGAGPRLGARGARAPGWRHAALLGEGETFVAAPSDASEAFCLRVRPSIAPEALRDGEILVLYETLARRGARRPESLRGGRLVFSAADRDLQLEVLRLRRPFPHPRPADPWTAPVPLDGPIWASDDSGGKNVYVGTERYVYRVNRRSGRSVDPFLTLDSALRGPGALIVRTEGLVVASRTAIGRYPRTEAR